MTNVNSFLQDNRKFIEERIKWLDSDLRLGINSEIDKKNKTDMKEFLEGLLSYTPNMNRVSGVPYEVDFRTIKQQVE
jgi:hypothetical protein